MRFVLTALMVARVVVAADFAPDFLPADTKVMFGLNVRTLMASPLLKDSGADVAKMGDEWLKVVSLVGFDPLHDLDDVLVAASGGKTNATGLIVLRGRFDLARLGAGAPRYHGVAMVQPNKADKSILALLDGTTALAGDAAVVRAAIDRRGHGAPLSASMAARVKSLSERFDIWGFGEVPPGLIPPGGQSKELESIDRFEFGLRVAKGVELGVEIHARSAEDATKLAGMAQMLKLMAASQGQQVPNFDVQVTDGTVKLSMAISEEEIKKAIEQQRGKAGASPAMGGAPVIVTSEPVSGLQPGSEEGGTGVVVLPGKKKR